MTPELPLPHNLDAERAVLGAILIDPLTIHAAVEVLRPEAFYRDAHRRIFAAMTALDEARSVVDFITLTSYLRAAGEIDTVGGPAYISSLTDGVPRATNVTHYARIVADAATKRRLLEAANRITSVAYQDAGTPLAEILDSAEQAIFDVAEHRGASFASFGDLARAAVGPLPDPAERQASVAGVPTGLADLDSMLAGGFDPADLVLIAARPSLGKTSLMLNAALHAAQHRGPAAVFSLEMTKEQIFMRALSGESRIPRDRLVKGEITHDEAERVGMAIAKLARTPIIIDDSPGITVLEIRAKARRAAAEIGISSIWIDYIQLIAGGAGGREQNRTQELANISHGLKALAKDLRIPVVALSQLSRAPEGRPDKRPQLSDLRESGALEQDADVVLMLYREDDDKKAGGRQARIAEIIIGKQRNGPTGTVKVAWNPALTTFATLVRTPDDDSL